MGEVAFVFPLEEHNRLVAAVYQKRGYDADEAAVAAKYCGMASWHGIKTHGALKALHLDEIIGSKVGGAVPKAKVKVVKSKFKAVEKWDAQKKLGQPVADAAMTRCCELADKYGVGIVAVDNSFHYLWGGGYVMEAARKGYIAYTNCTAGLAEVVPFMGRKPTIGTNPHSWGLPTTSAVGYPIVIDWATSAVAMGRVQQLAREGKSLPPNCAVDKEGNTTTDPKAVAALLPFGAHKGYGLGLLIELYGAYMGGYLPSLRGKPQEGGPHKRTMSFFFQAIHPEALGVGTFKDRKAMEANVAAVIKDILCSGNEKCLLPGQLEAEAAARSAKHGGLLFTENEVKEFKREFEEAGIQWEPAGLKKVGL